ncbi:Tyrosinase domain-containing protein/PPO1_DWL domain-containing protein/PPO1_KFDV domain-containing protein [Cephalotus follicularis]|uniref:Tyrosinase domain-containing protein/PPO1_DWL domain-containing protein/PPO1_KFDV domain-containing protein n=1 Tax=Cephalotus follicularis TaxID=3775 RepID=A0A1Q3B9T6_CEPFO|nr:Tyrosinase domain-containing protein/PPO1_DWL domain-containing protein/PPO1_KFDV domain-containing protein [Cephalotus follicularis]
MASLSQSPTTTTTAAAAAAATTGTYSLFLQNPSQLPIIRKRKPYLIPRVLSCKATNNDQNPTPTSNNTQQSFLNKFDRRNVLIGLGGLYSTASLSTDPLALTAPLSAPDVTKCGKADLPKGVNTINCCPPPTTKIVDFKLPLTSTKLRVRPAAHLVNDDYIAKYNKAIELMKALPDDDPRSFYQQANVHCAYCDGAYHQVGFPSLDFQVHNSWLFFPFHRYYLHFYERILAKLIDDPTFALPFWNWDSPAGMQMPAMFTDPKSAIYDKFRNANHQPPTLIDLDYNGTDVKSTNQDQLSSNLSIMYRQMVSNGKTAKLFFGDAYRAGDESDPGAGAVENIPHGPVHVWCGDTRQPNLEDMGILYSAARDPIFFSHHSNVDRMWTIWKTLGGKRSDLTDPDWLDAGFVFYDENANLVRVKVRDSLDNTKLGYVYQDVDIPWLQSKPTPRKSVKNVAKKVAHHFGRADASEIRNIKLTTMSEFPLVLDKAVSVEVSRPKKSRSKKEKEEAEELLVIEDIQFDKDARVKFDVYVNDDDEANIGADDSEFAGSFVNVPHKHKHGKKIKTILRLGLTDLLEDLGAEDDDSVVVTLVPRYGKGLVTIGGIKIDFAHD